MVDILVQKCEQLPTCQHAYSFHSGAVGNWTLTLVYPKEIHTSNYIYNSHKRYQHKEGSG